MAVTPSVRPWTELFAARTLASDGGILEILALAGNTELVQVACLRDSHAHKTATGGARLRRLRVLNDRATIVRCRET